MKTSILIAVVFIVSDVVDVEGMEEGDVNEEEGRGLLMFDRSRGCGGMSASSIRIKGVLNVSTIVVMRSRLTMVLVCMVLRLLQGTCTNTR